MGREESACRRPIFVRAAGSFEASPARLLSRRTFGKRRSPSHCRCDRILGGRRLATVASCDNRTISRALACRSRKGSAIACPPADCARLAKLVRRAFWSTVGDRSTRSRFAATLENDSMFGEHTDNLRNDRVTRRRSASASRETEDPSTIMAAKIDLQEAKRFVEILVSK